MTTPVDFQPLRFLYLLRFQDMWVGKLGYTSGVGSWYGAKQFRNFRDAQEAVLDPSWHNDPDNVKRAEIVRLTVSIEAKFYDWRNPN